MAYTLSDLQSSVQDDLKDPSFQATRITRYLNYGQLAIFNTHLFRFCEKDYSGTVAIGSLTKAQQSDHQATIGGTLVDPSNTARQFPLDKTTYMPHRDFFDLYPVPSLNTAAMPSAWTEFGGAIYFSCPLDITYTFYQRYYRVPTSMSSASSVPDVPEAFREPLELYANYRAEKYRGNHDIAATYKQDFEDAVENMAIRFSAPTQMSPVVMGSTRVRVSEDE